MIADYNCWEGWELRGKVVTTVLRGNVLIEDERWVGPKASGEFLSRTLLPGITSNPRDLGATSELSERAATSA